MLYVSRIRTLVVLAAAGFVLLSGPAKAQGTLSQALWQESISLDADNQQAMFQGADFFAPESHTEELSGTGFAVSGSVQFGTGVAPEGTAEVTWDVSEVTIAVTLSTNVNIDFQARVVETATPPVTVEEVPVRVQASGSGTVEEVFGSQATARFVFRVPGTEIVILTNIDVDGDSQSTEPSTDSFTVDETPMVPVNMVALVSMVATARMATVGVANSMGSATGMIDPVIEVADELIPGTSESYRDYFTVEFSEGYDAQTPVESMTIGKIKRRFSEPR